MIDAADLKQSIAPVDFYCHVLPGMPTPKPAVVWANGGLCCFHNDTRPRSFFINTNTGAFVCYSCQRRGGDIISFIMEREGLAFREALERIAQEWGVGV